VVEAVEALHLDAESLHELDGHVDVGLGDELILQGGRGEGRGEK
jgi:hypothetical protein